jgi:hypothetical protein
MNKEVRLYRISYDGMVTLVHLAAERKRKSVWPITSPAMVQFVAIYSFPLLGLLNPSYGQLKVIRTHLRRRREQPLRDQC